MKISAEMCRKRRDELGIGLMEAKYQIVTEVMLHDLEQATTVAELKEIIRILITERRN